MMNNIIFFSYSGVIFDGKELFYIEPLANVSSLADEHLLMKHSDLVANFTCGMVYTYSKSIMSHCNISF